MSKDNSPKETVNFQARYKDGASKYRQFSHYHASFEICFFVDVSKVDLDIFIKDKRYKISNGDIIFINEFDVHRFIFNSNANIFNRYIVNFKKDYILPYLNMAGVSNLLDDLSNYEFAHAKTNLIERDKLVSLFELLVEPTKTDSKILPENLQEATIISSLILILIKIYSLFKSSQGQDKPDFKDILVHKIIKFIDHNYTSEITLDMLADKFFVDKSYMCTTFKKMTNLTIMNYVQQRRIIEAQKLLKKDLKKKIVDICFECGFNNTQHFHRTFKRITNTTPNMYRKLHSSPNKPPN